MSGIVHSDESLWVCEGDCLDVMSELPDGSVDAVVTDPPGRAAHHPRPTASLAEAIAAAINASHNRKKARMQQLSHRCHARNCRTAVPPKLFMCKHHWYMVPKPLRDAVWATYRPGQEIDKQPSDEYLAITTAAIEEVARKEAPR